MILLVASNTVQAREVTETELVRDYLAGAEQRSVKQAGLARASAAAAVDPYLPRTELQLRREESLGPGPTFDTTVVGLEVPLEIGGRHGLNKEAASMLATSARLDRHARLVQDVCQLRQLALSAYTEQQRVTLLAANQQRLEALADALAKLVRSGEKARFDLDRARLLIQTRARTLQRKRARLAALLGQLSTLSGVELTAVKLTAVKNSAALQIQAAATPPALRALGHQVQAAALKQKVARRSWVPDLELYAAYRLDRSDDLFGHGYELGLSLNLPLADVGRGPRARAEAASRRLRAEQETLSVRYRATEAALGRRLATLLADRIQSGGVVKLEKLGQDATRRYLGGVTTLAGLTDTLQAVEAAALGRIENEAALREAALKLECLRGVFVDKALAAMIKEASQ